MLCWNSWENWQIPAGFVRAEPGVPPVDDVEGPHGGVRVEEIARHISEMCGRLLVEYTNEVTTLRNENQALRNQLAAGPSQFEKPAHEDTRSTAASGSFHEILPKPSVDAVDALKRNDSNVTDDPKRKSVGWRYHEQEIAIEIPADEGANINRTTFAGIGITKTASDSAVIDQGSQPVTAEDSTRDNRPRAFTYGLLSSASTESLEEIGSMSTIRGINSRTLTNTGTGSFQSGVSFARSLSIKQAHKRLSVNIIGATGLRDADFIFGFGCSDPYCLCGILHKDDQMMQTKVVYNSLHPIWNHEAEIDGFDEDDTLVFTVVDYDPVSFPRLSRKKFGDLLGRATLAGEHFYEKGTFEGVLPLQDSGSPNAHLKVRVHVQGKHRDLEDDKAVVDELLRDACDMWPIPTRPPDTLISYKEDEQCHHVVGDILAHPTKCVNVQRFMLHPTDHKRIFWDTLGLVAVGYDFFSVPYGLVWRIEDSFVSLGLGWIICSYWTLDFVGSFFQPFYVDGMIEMHPGMIARHYFKTWMFPDLLMLLFDWVYMVVAMVEGSSGMKGGKLVRTVRSIRALRSVRMVSMLRVNRLGRIFALLTEMVQVEWVFVALRIAFAILVIIGANHAIACAWWAIGNWHNDDNWIKKKQLEDEAPIYGYLTAYHWAITQITPASMDVVPRNLRERVFTVVVDLGGLIVFSTFVSGITASMTQLRNLNQARRDQDARLRQYCRENRISVELTKSIQNFANAQRSNHMRHIKEQDIPVFKHLPERILVRMHEEVYGNRLVSHPFFEVMTFIGKEAFQKLCHTAVSLHVLMSEQELFLKGTRATGMFFILSGGMEYRRAAEVYRVPAGMWVCEVALWLSLWYHRGVLHESTQKTCEVLGLHGNAVRGIIDELKPESAARRFIGSYAALFVRSGSDPRQWVLKCSDVWGEFEHMSDLAFEALDNAGVEVHDTMWTNSMLRKKGIRHHHFRFHMMTAGRRRALT